MSHTPGPWQVYADLPSTEPNWHIVTNASRMRVIANVHIEPGNAMDEANARLIAAAPELLEALQTLVDEGECYCLDAQERAGRGVCGHCQGKAVLAKVQS